MFGFGSPRSHIATTTTWKSPLSFLGLIEALEHSPVTALVGVRVA